MSDTSMTLQEATIPVGAMKWGRMPGWAFVLGLALALGLVHLPGIASSLCAQDQAAEQGSGDGDQPDGDRLAAGEAPVLDPAELETDGAADAAGSAGVLGESGLSLLDLLIKGGWMMVPIGLSSVLMVMIAIERWLSLRRNKVMPAPLVAGLARSGSTRGNFDPRRAYRLCQAYPSVTAQVVRAMLLKIGRPHSEVEHAVQEASQREADRMYANVRWLNLIGAVAPLLGLLGTVWGMIQTFHGTTQLSPLENKASYLASGIYVALVTTLGGLTVAIPAVILAHHFEGRIQTIFHRIDELLFQLLPQVERFEGRLRVDHQSLSDGDRESAVASVPPAQPATPPAPTARS